MDRNLIFDVGMNICEDTDFYLKKGFKVVAIEANPALCERAVETHDQEIQRGELCVLNVAILDRKGSLRFYVCNEMSAWSTAHTQMRTTGQKQPAQPSGRSKSLRRPSTM
jgi:FkbM family methyltransferase